MGAFVLINKEQDYMNKLFSNDWTCCPAHLFRITQGFSYTHCSVPSIVHMKKCETVIGRDRSLVDVYLDSTNCPRTISRIHAHIIYSNNQWRIRDQHSVNGVYVNDYKVYESILKDKDILVFGRGPRQSATLALVQNNLSERLQDRYDIDPITRVVFSNLSSDGFVTPERSEFKYIFRITRPSLMERVCDPCLESDYDEESGETLIASPNNRVKRNLFCDLDNEMVLDAKRSRLKNTDADGMNLVDNTLGILMDNGNEYFKCSKCSDGMICECNNFKYLEIPRLLNGATITTEDGDGCSGSLNRDFMSESSLICNVIERETEADVSITSMKNENIKCPKCHFDELEVFVKKARDEIFSTISLIPFNPKELLGDVEMARVIAINEMGDSKHFFSPVICWLCGDFLIDPVVLMCGDAFCRDCLDIYRVIIGNILSVEDGDERGEMALIDEIERVTMDNVVTDMHLVIKEMNMIGEGEGEGEEEEEEEEVEKRHDCEDFDRIDILENTSNGEMMVLLENGLKVRDLIKVLLFFIGGRKKRDIIFRLYARIEDINAYRLEVNLRRRKKMGLLNGFVGELWNLNERDAFIKGYRYYKGKMRVVYCRSVGLEGEWIRRATTLQLVIACDNLRVLFGDVFSEFPTNCAISKLGMECDSRMTLDEVLRKRLFGLISEAIASSLSAHSKFHFYLFRDGSIMETR